MIWDVLRRIWPAVLGALGLVALAMTGRQQGRAIEKEKARDQDIRRADGIRKRAASARLHEPDIRYRD